MNKSELKEKIKQVYQAKFAKKVDLENPTPITLDDTRFSILVKFPEIKEVLIKLLTSQFDLFLKDIQWVAPRPTTFRIILSNDQPFYLIYTDRTWIAKVEGKKYYLLNISEEEQAADSISRILAYGVNEVKKEEVVSKEETPKEDNEPTPKEEPEELKEIEGESEVELNKTTLMSVLGPEKLATLKSFGANKNGWVSIHKKLAKKLGMSLDKFYENNLEEKVRDIISK